MLRCVFGALLLVSACGGKTGLDLHADGAIGDAQLADAQMLDAQMIDARVVVDTGTPDVAVVDGQSGDAQVRDACEPADCSVTLPVPIEQEAYVKANDTQSGDLFGSALDVDGDTLVVGAPWTMRESPHPGSVEVFVRDAGTWALQATLTGTDGYGFGSAVAISGDTLAVRGGASLYVFVRSAGAWRREAFPMSSTVNLRGSAVAISGDTLAFEAGVDGTTEHTGGVVHVWTRSEGMWSQQAVLKASSPTLYDGFGGSIAIANDTIVVGAVSLGLAESAAYVFVRSGGVWTQQSYLRGSNTEAQDMFGGSVAIAADTIVVGASEEGSCATGVNGDQTDNSAGHSGAAYVFVRRGTMWTQQAYLKASNNEASWWRGEPRGWGGDRFGSSVAISADTIVVGAPEEDSAAVGINGDQYNNDDYWSGAAYVFARAGDAWTQLAYLKASNNYVNQYASYEYFGTDVAVSGRTIAVTAPGEDSQATGINGDQTNHDAWRSGAVYVFGVIP